MEKEVAKKYIKQYFLDEEKKNMVRDNIKNYESTLEKYKLLSKEYGEKHSDIINQIEKRMKLTEIQLLENFGELALLQLRMKPVENILRYLPQEEVELLRQKIYEGRLETQIEINSVNVARSTIFRKMDKIYKLFEKMKEDK